MNRTNLLKYMAGIIDRLKKEGRAGTAHVYDGTLRRVADFLGGRPLEVSGITPVWLKSFETYLLKRQLRWNTISTYMRMLRAVYLRAVDEGRAPYRPRLFKNVYTGTEVTVKRALDERTFHRLQQTVDVSPGLERSRRIFLLLFMLRGIPFVDLAYLRRCDLRGDTLTYRRRKTGARLTLRVEPEAMVLLRSLANPDRRSPYLFPFIRRPGMDEYRQYRNALRSLNHGLYRLAVHLGLRQGLSSYAARHSWATIANYCDYPQELISNAMGHSSVKVTEVYFKRHTEERIDAMNRGILSYLFPGKNDKLCAGSR